MSAFDGFFNRSLAESDADVARGIAAELGRQREQLELIASENLVSRAVLEAQGSVLTNKYAEGYPGKRYYGGCEHVDVTEQLAIDRAKQLFGAEFANVQPHSGAQANMTVLFALLSPGDTILGMSLAHGGHLTHGAAPTVSGRWFKPVQYGVGQATQTIDYDEVERLAKEHQPKMIVAGGAHPSPVPHAHVVTATTHKTLRGPRGGLVLTNDEAIAKKINSAVFPGIQGGPLEHVIAAKAVAFKEALQPAFKTYAAQVVKNAQALANTLIKRGVDIVSGGTDTHLMLVDLRKKGITG